MRVLPILSLALGALLAGEELEAQAKTCDSAFVRAVRIHTDSIMRRHVASSAHNNAVRRLTARVDTLVLVCSGQIFRVEVTFNYTTKALWPTGRMGAYDEDGRATVCAAVDVGGVWHLGSSAVNIQAVHNDSLTWALHPAPGIAGIREACRFNWSRDPALGSIVTAPVWPVRWVLQKVEPFTIAFPIPQPIVP